MLPAASRLYGKLSARSKLEALAVILLLTLCVGAYFRGKHNGRINAKIVQVDRERRQNADTIKKKTQAVERVQHASDTAHSSSVIANKKAESFALRPVPGKPAVLQTPANSAQIDLRPLVRELYAVIANRDSALTLERAANAALKRENALLLIERDTTAALIKSLNRQIALDVSEIALLKKVKTPRFGIKTGILIGAVTALAVDAGIDHLKKTGVDRSQAPDI
jgi:hypothetical protein